MLNHKNIILLLSIFALISCNDFLNEPPNKNTSLPVTTAEQLDFLLNSYNSFYQETSRTLIHSTDDYGVLKELYAAKSNTYGLASLQFATWDTEYLPFDTREGFWSSEYRKIFTANLVLHNLPKVTGTDEHKSQLSAEAHLIRAYSTWNLAQTYSLPYTDANASEMGVSLKHTTSFEEAVKRSTLKETYDFIEQNLEEALKLSNKMEYVNNKYRSWRGSKGAAHAFAARYYLNRNNYDKALEHANVALGEHDVMMNYNVDMRYSSITSNVTVDGVAVPIRYPYTHDNQTDMNDMMEWKEFYYFRLLSHESWWYIPSRELLDLYDKENDLRYKYHMVENYSYDRGLTNPAYEYPGYVFFYKDRIPSGPTVAEMLLIKAESLARQGKVSEALTSVNALRANRMKSTAGSTVIDIRANNKDEAIKKILEERRREMPFAQRWNDLRRLNNNDDSNDDVPVLTREFYEYTSSTINKDMPKIYTLNKDSRRYAAPIPDSEILSSGGKIKQNTY